MFTSEELAGAAGISYRRLDFWVRKGHVPGASLPGSGFQRHFTSAQASVVLRIAELVRHGFTLAAAAEHANSGASERVTAHTRTIVDVESLDATLRRDDDDSDVLHG
jgi:DNA-binding transcriptional MerR regulator